MVSLTLLAVCMLGFIGTFIQSRRVTEASVLHAAASSLVYGIIEQIKTLDYSSLLPSNPGHDPLLKDPNAPACTDLTDMYAGSQDKTPYVRVRINQDLVVWLYLVYTPTPKGTTPAPKGPTTTPVPTMKTTSDPTQVAADALANGAINNVLGSLPLSTVTGTASQTLGLNIWLWIDEIPDATRDVNEVKRVTLVYTYSYLDGGKERIVRDREVFVRTNYDQ